MEDHEEIIYLALSNQVLLYSELLEGSLDEENKNMATYILQRSEDLLLQYENKIMNKETTIQKPQWDKI